MENTAANSLYDLLVTRDFEPEILDASGKTVTDPAEAELFSFDWKTSDKNYGTVVILIGSDNNLEVYFGDNLGRSMEGDDKQQWYRFLEQMKQFATRNLLTFELNNLNRLKYTMQGMAAIKEGLFEGYYGTRKVSYSDQPKKTKLVIKHNRTLGEGDARYRAIESLFVETADGERFRVPSRSLTHGKMLARHVAEGGTPYDAFGQHITNVVSEMATLSRFIRAAKHKGFQGEAAALLDSAVKHYSDLKSRAKSMIGQRGYHSEKSRFRPGKFSDSEVTVEAIRDMFLEQTLDHRIEEALPVLTRLAAQSTTTDTSPKPMKEISAFESWASNMTEGTWAMPDTPESQKKLSDIMSQELAVGPDAINATEQLYDILGDDVLFDRLEDLALQDPDADARPLIQQRMKELGIISDIQDAVAENSFGTPIGGAMDMPLRERAQKRFEVDGWRYETDVDEEDDVVKIWHTAVSPDGVSEIIDFNPYSTMDKKTFDLWLKLDRPKRPGPGGPLNQEQIEGMARARGLADLNRDMARAGMDEDLDTDGVMMTKPSNMSSESRQIESHLQRLLELAKG